MNSRRLVSIAIPAYKPQFFEQALLSAFNQTHDEIEIVICDDCRSEAVHDIVERLRPISPWPIRYFRNDVPLGEAKNVARCVRQSHGEYLKFLYDDDLLQPDCVSLLLELLDDHPEISLASSRRHMIDEQGNILPENWATGFPFSHDVIFSGPELIAFLGQFTVNFIGEPTCVMCRRADIAAFGDDLMVLNGSSIDWVGDVALYFKLLRRGNLAMLIEPLSLFRVSEVQFSAGGRTHPKVAQESHAIFQKRIGELGWSQRIDEPMMIKVATFMDRYRFTEVDLRPYFASAQNSKHLAFSPSRWMAGHTVRAAQQALIDSVINANSSGSSLLLIICDDAGDMAGLRSTINSITERQSLSHALSVAVFSINPCPVDWVRDARIEWHRLKADNEAAAINRKLAEHYCDWFMIVKAGTVFTVQGVSRLRLKLPELNSSPAFYADEMHRTASGNHEPAFRPDFNLDFLLSYPAALCKHWIFHRQTLLDFGGFDTRYPRAYEFDYILRLIQRENVEHLEHLAEPILICDEILAEKNEDQTVALSRYLQSRGYPGSHVLETSDGQYRICYNHQQRPLVSILIPTKDQLGILSRCVESVLEKTAYDNYEIIIIDNNSEQQDALEWLAGIESLQSDKVRILRHPYPFNYSEINNTAARHARGEYLVLLNNDTAVLHAEWLDNLLNHAIRPEVGIVGAKLYFPNGTVQHAGVILGIDSPAQHVFLGHPHDSPGYMQRLKVDQNYSAVTAACLMIRKSVYMEVGGLDEVEFKISYNDVDLCLKVRALGYLVVWTPHAALLHESSVSQIQTDTTAYEKRISRFRGEQFSMYRKWLPALANDPAYNRHFALNGAGFEIEPVVDLTWRALPWRPLPLVLLQRQRRWNDGDCRNSIPLQALRDADIVDGAISQRLLNVVEIERLRPHVVIYQQPFTSDQIPAIELITQLSPALRVLDLDRLPANYKSDPAFLRSLELVNRVVVASSELAAAVDGMHDDIRIMAESLPISWSNIRSRRQTGNKLRVGWRGDHDQLDLRLLAEIVPALADEVDFVVMGWCPIELRPFVRDQRFQVEESGLADALAGMDLDLALLPLLDEPLQSAQSLARLLHYGACGFAVLCSENACDAGDLPVTRLCNYPSAWIQKIRAYIAAPQVLTDQGIELQTQTLGGHLLHTPRMEAWRSVWLD